MFQAVRGVTTFAAALGQIPPLYRVLKSWFPVAEKLTGGLDASEAIIAGIMRRALSDRRLLSELGDIPDKDFMGTIWRHQLKEGISDKEMMSIMGVNIIAGVEDVAILLNGIMYQLLQYPDKMQKLLGELQEKQSQGKLSTIPHNSELEDCPYLQAVLYKAL